MIFALNALLVFGTPQVAEVHTELQVEATRPPDRRAELAAEISRAQAELEEVRRVAAALPDGEQKSAEEKRLTALGAQIDQMRKLVAELPEPPSDLVPHPAPAPPAPPAQSANATQQEDAPPGSPWIALGFGLILGAMLAFLIAFRALPGDVPKGGLRGPQLAILAAVISAVGPQLLSLGYDQLPIVLLWIVLGFGGVTRMGLRRVRSQIEEFSLDRVRRKVSEAEDD